MQTRRFRWLFVLLVGSISAQTVPPSSAQHGAFAFPNKVGTQLLTIPALTQPEKLRTALCTNNVRTPIRYERQQPAAPGDTGRHSPHNFDKVAGTLFSVTKSRLSETASCFLAADAMLSSATLFRVEILANHTRCSPDAQRRIESSRLRSVLNCWTIAHMSATRQLVLTEFTQQDKQALASLVLMDRNRTIFADYPATFKGDGVDLWRVDDGGVLSPKGFEILFVLQRGNTYTVGVRWSGSEGASLAIFTSGTNNKFTQVISDYWYQAPE